MNSLFIALFSIIFSVFFAFRNYYQLWSERTYTIGTAWGTPEFYLLKKKWHSWQFALQVLIGIACGATVFTTWLSFIAHVLLFGIIFWILFDGILGHKLAGDFFHVDENVIGKFFRRFPHPAVYLFATKILIIINVILLCWWSYRVN